LLPATPSGQTEVVELDLVFLHRMEFGEPMQLAVNRFHPGISHWIWMPLATKSAAMEGGVTGFKPVAPSSRIDRVKKLTKPDSYRFLLPDGAR
jgi:hypothetical protein